MPRRVVAIVKFLHGCVLHMQTTKVDVPSARGVSLHINNAICLPLMVQEISKGSLPYLYGGKPPGCKSCKSSEFVSKFCQYGMPGHGQCDKGQIYYLVQQFLDREFHEVLQFTPCDLWPLLRGRTLYFSGDSQTQVAGQQLIYG